MDKAQWQNTLGTQTLLAELQQKREKAVAALMTRARDSGDPLVRAAYTAVSTVDMVIDLIEKEEKND